MRRLLSVLAFLALALIVCAPLSACSCGGLPTVTLRMPVQFDSEPATTAGPRMMAVQQWYAPSYAPAAANCGPAGYSFTPGPAQRTFSAPPCDRPPQQP